jgi:hypothetical protein
LYATWDEYDTARAKRKAKLEDARMAQLMKDRELPYWEKPLHCNKPSGRTWERTDYRRLLSWFPQSSALSKALQHQAPAILAAGWTVSFSRTALSRCITFTRSRANS